MAAFPLPAGHPFTAVRPGYAGYETAPGISILNATASYVGAVGDYPNNTVTLELFATFGGTWTITTPTGLTLQTAPVAGQAYAYATYTGGTRGSTYTFTSITLTPAQGSAVSWSGVAPSVTLTVPTITTTISPSGSYYIGGNAIYLEPLPANFGTQTILGLTDYVFVCSTSAAYATLDSVGIGVIPFPPGTTFAPGTTTTLNFTVACRSNGIIGVASPAYTVNIVSPAVPLLTAQSIVGNTINLSFSTTTPGCTFNLSYGGANITSNITSPYGYTAPFPGIYNFSVQALLSNLSVFSALYSATIQPPQPTNVVSTVVGTTLTSVSLAWTSLGSGYTYKVYGTGTAIQLVASPPAVFEGLSVGAKTFYVQSVYAGVASTTCNVQLSIDTQPPTNFTATTLGATISLNWTASPTSGRTYNITSAAAGNVAGITGTTYSYTSLAAGAYSFAIVGVSGTIQSSSLTATATVVITTPTNLVATTTGTTANLTWQDSITGTTFSIAWSGPQSGTAASSVKSAAITGLTTTGVYTFSVRSLYSGIGSPTPPITTTATIVTAPTSFTAVANGNVITLGWSQSTPNCSFLVSSALGNSTTTNTSLTYSSAAVASYTFSITPTVTGTSFVGPTVTTTNARVFNGPSPVVATLSGPNVNVAWTAIAGCTYTVSSSPVITDPPPAPPGTSTSVQFVVPNPQTYTFTVIATDGSGNKSIPATSTALLVPLPAPINIGSTMTTSSVVLVTWTEQQDQCSFTINGVPAGITPEISLVSSILSGGLPAYNYQGILRGVPSTTGLTFSVVASLGAVNSVASSSVTQYTFPTFNVTLSATCSQSGSTNNATAVYTMTSPAYIYGPGINGATPYIANMVYSQAGTLSPAANTATAGLAGTYGAGYNQMGTNITSVVPSSFAQFVVPPTNIVVTANATSLFVKWTDSTTAGCRYTISGTPGTFRSNVADGNGTTGVTFTGASIGTAYTFVITASSAGSYTASRTYGSVTTENATVPYTITSISVPSTAVTPINFPTTFTATAVGLTVTMVWSAVTGATAYNALNGTTTLINTTARTHSFTGVAGTSYSLTIQAVTGSTASNTTAAVTVIPQNNPTFSYFLQAGSNLTVGTAISPSGPSLSINTPTGLSAPTASAGAFTFTNVAANTTYSFTVTATGTNATSTATSSFTTMATPVITSATAQGTATITVNWTYDATAPAVDGFSVYYNDAIISNVGSSIRSVVFNQTAQTNNTDTVYVVAKIGTATSRPSATVSVTDLATTPTITEASITGNAVTVKWSYATSGRALSSFQVWNSALTTTYGNAVSYSSTASTYTSFFTVANGTYTFKVVGTDSVGSTVTSANSSSVTDVAPPVINSIVQTGGTIVVTCATPASGVTLSIPSTPTGLTASSSTSTTFTFTGAAQSTLYSFTVQSAITGGSTDSATSSITTLATPGIPTVSANGTTVTVNMPSYSSSASFSVYNGSTLVASAGVGATSTTFTGVVGTTYALTLVATIGANSSIASPAPLTSPLSAATGCILWLDGADPNNTGSPVANGTTITTWKDKTVNANNASVESGTITVTGNSLVFNGISTYLRVPGIKGKIVNTPFVIFIVETLGASGNLFYFGDNIVNASVAAGSLHTGYRAINNQTFAFYGSDLEDYSIIPQTGETRIWTLYLPSSANRNTRRNGNVDVTFSNNTRLGAFNDPVIGMVLNGNFFKGTISEIIVFPSDIGIPAIQRIEQYLAKKWQISCVGGVITPLATPTATATANGGTITVTCGTPTAGTVLNIPTTPTGLTRSSYTTATTFTYTGAVGGTSYSFAVYAYNGPATSLVASTSATALYKPGTPTVTATGTTVNVSWTYTGTSYTGITFSIVYSSATVAATTITTAVSPTSLTASFIATAAAGEYTVYVYASSSSGSNRSDNSASAFITIIGTPTLTQNYQLTTQTKIVATVAATNATSYAGTGGTLSAPAVSGSTLTWTGATAGTRYTGVSVQGIKGTTTTTTTGLSIYSAFDPKSIPGCIIWMDAADTTTYTPGTNVTAWTNKGTFSVTGSTTAGTFNSTSTTINNLPAMAVSAGASMYIGGMTYTTKFRSMFFVLIMGAAGGTTTTYLLCGGAFSPTVYSQNNSDIQFNYEVTTTNLLVTSNPTSFFGARSILSITSGIYVNGAAQTLSTTNANLGQFIDEYSSTLTIGKAAPSGTAAFTLGEVLLYDGALNTTQRQAIEGYLAWKWGMQTSLSSTNPYSTLASPPAIAPPLAITAPTSVDYLVIGGGGGGGSRFGGGGGAGGFLSGAAAVAPSTSYTVTVGAGGAGGASTGGSGTPTPTNGARAGGDGSPSVFATITAAGGGGGGYGDSGNGRNGGSGGGGAGRFTTTAGTGTAGQGNAGGTNGSTSYVGGGGGGAGGAAVTTVAGTGKVSSITGVSVTYAGGGGGGGTADGSVNGSAGGAGGGGAGGGYSGTSTPPIAGTANTGSGGGGGAYNTSYTGAANGPNNQPGAAGGSGVVILSYPSTFNTLASITGTLAPTTPSIVGTNIVYRFTSGTGTITW